MYRISLTDKNRVPCCLSNIYAGREGYEKGRAAVAAVINSTKFSTKLLANAVNSSKVIFYSNWTAQKVGTNKIRLTSLDCWGNLQILEVTRI